MHACIVSLRSSGRTQVGGRLQGYGNRNREGLKVGDADVEGGQAEQLGAFLGVAVKADGGAAAAQLHNLHFAPGYAMQARVLAPALADFCLGEDASQKALAVMLVNLAHAVNLDDINADRDIDALSWMQRRGQTRQTRRAEKPVGDGFARLAYKRRKQYWRIFIHRYFLSISAGEGRAFVLLGGSTEGAGSVPRPIPR